MGKGHRTIRCTGRSMFPTIRHDDILHVLPCKGTSIKAGDVIVFVSAEGKQIVHRVISCGLNGIRTKGDNNPEPDCGVAHPADIIGRVLFLHRQNRAVKVHGGFRGRIQSIAVKISRLVIPRLGPLYQWLARRGLFRRIIPFTIKPRILCFRRTTGQEMHLVIGRWLIGRRPAGQKKWQIRRPFRLFIDETSLPDREK